MDDLEQINHPQNVISCFHAAARLVDAKIQYRPMPKLLRHFTLVYGIFLYGPTAVRLVSLHPIC